MANTYRTGSWLLVRGLGLVHFCAHLSLALQIQGLLGSDGILPAARFLEAVARQLGQGAWTQLPTVFWLGCSDAALGSLCWAGVAVSLMVLLGVAPRVGLAWLWVSYLSLVGVGQVFLGYQWDTLLLEVGWISILAAPFTLRPRALRDSLSAPTPIRWALTFLTFRLMFAAGVVKLSSGDPTWWNGSALTFHYWTQPLPTWPGWYANQLPLWTHQLSVGLLFVIELVMPFGFLVPGWPRRLAALSTTFLMGVIAVTGNYGFFNLLVAIMALSCVDDAFFETLWRGVSRSLRGGPPRPESPCPIAPAETPSPVEPATPPGPTTSSRSLAGAVVAAAGLLSITLGFAQLAFTCRLSGRDHLVPMARTFAPWHLASSYGLFAVMTTTRPELIVEGSTDGDSWKVYTFPYKATDVERRPGFCAPHMPRLDWQLWFAALGDLQNARWMVPFAQRLLEGSPSVRRLLAVDPFPDAPPRFLRVRKAQFTCAPPDGSAWWTSVPDGEFLPIVSLRVKTPPR